MLTRAITLDKPTTADATTLIDYLLAQVWRALTGEATGPEAFTLLLRLLTTHSDRADTGKGCTQ